MRPERSHSARHGRCTAAASALDGIASPGIRVTCWSIAATKFACRAAPLLFGGMSKLLDGETKGAAASGGLAAGGVASLRGFCYQALGQLATRQPSLVVGTPDLAARVFGALATEPEAVRPSVQDAARSLASAYKGCGGGVAMAIEGLLLSSIDASAQSGAAVTAAEAGGVGARRLVAAQWARDLFPFSHAPARYLCVVACGDGKQDVRDVGKAGLRPPDDDDNDEFARARRGRLAKKDADDGTKKEDEAAGGGNARRFVGCECLEG